MAETKEKPPEPAAKTPEPVNIPTVKTKYCLKHRQVLHNDYEPFEPGTEMGVVECHGLVNAQWLAQAIRNGSVITKEEWERLQILEEQPRRKAQAKFSSG